MKKALLIAGGLLVVGGAVATVFGVKKIAETKVDNEPNEDDQDYEEVPENGEDGQTEA